MRRSDMRMLASACRDELTAGDAQGALSSLLPALEAHTPFHLLDLAGGIIAEAAPTSPAAFAALLDSLAASGEIGAWPLIASALAAAHLPQHLPWAFAEARRYILEAHVWHATDAIGERVLGEGLRADFPTALGRLETWREEISPWLRRAIGVAVHRYAKRERDQPERAIKLLELLEPLFEEREMSALKGIGWGLKTIGRFYPNLLGPWLRTQMAAQNPRRPMVRKATTYLTPQVKTELP